MENNRTAVNPLTEPIRAGARAALKEVNTVHTALVVSFDSQTQRAAIQIAVNRITPEGYKAHPVIDNVPVIFSGNNDYAMGFKIEADIEGLLLFSQRDIDAFLESGVQVDPISKRMFALRDCVFIPCKIADTKPITNFRNDGMWIAKRDYSTFLHMKDDDTAEMTVKTFYINGDIVHVGNHTQTGDFDQQGNRQIQGNTTQTGTVDNTGDVTITGNETVSGNVACAAMAASGESKAGSMKADSIDAPSVTSNGVVLDTHTHPIAGPNTGPPS